MKLLRKGNEHFEMVLNEDEWEGFKDVLNQYPKTQSNHHSLTSKDHPDPDLKESDQWLKETTTIHQGTRKEQLKKWLSSISSTTEDDEKTYCIAIDASRADWLIEILNDVRIGIWAELGSPSPEEISATEWKHEDWPKLWTMELSGMFQSVILKCLIP